MNCIRHNDKETVAACSKCGAGVCADCASLSGIARESYGILCANCYTTVLHQTRESITQERGKKLKRAIISMICYALGLGMLVYAYSDELGVQAMFVGFLLCGFYTGVTWYKAAREAHDDYERKHGATYTISSSGTISKDNGGIMKVMYFLMGTFLGIVVTPCRIIIDVVGASRLKKRLGGIRCRSQQSEKFLSH